MNVLNAHHQAKNMSKQGTKSSSSQNMSKQGTKLFKVET